MRSKQVQNRRGYIYGKKKKGHVIIYSITDTETFIFRGYSEDAQTNLLNPEVESTPKIAENKDDNKPNIESEPTKLQIEKPAVLSIYKLGNIQI